MEKIQFNLSIDEANKILAALGQQPYREVAGLIQKIQEQGTAQTQPVQPAPTANTEVPSVLESENLIQD